MAAQERDLRTGKFLRTYARKHELEELSGRVGTTWPQIAFDLIVFAALGAIGLKAFGFFP